MKSKRKMEFPNLQLLKKEPEECVRQMAQESKKKTMKFKSVHCKEFGAH